MKLENDLFNKNDSCLLTSPILDFNDLEDYLDCCEHDLAFVNDNEFILRRCVRTLI
jgi:hypothetical protein